MVLERIKNSKPEDYRNWEDVKNKLDKNGISIDNYTAEMLFWAKQDLNEISLYYKNLSNELGDKFYSEVRCVIES